MFSKGYRRRILIVGVALAVAVLSILHVVVGYFKTPPGHVFMWTGHYYLDYFGYVQAIAQGIRGNWLYENPYTQEDSGATFLVWGLYVLMGKVGGLFGLSPIAIYWGAIFVLSLVLALLIFLVIRKLLHREPFYIQFSAYLLALFAGPFLKIRQSSDGITLLPYDFWYAPSSMFRRFESVPHHLLGNITILAILVFTAWLFDKMTDGRLRKIGVGALIVGIAVLFNLTFYPYSTILFIIALLLTGAVLVLAKATRGRAIRLLVFLAVLFAVVIPGGLVIWHTAQSFPLIARAHQIDLTFDTYPSGRLLFLSTGPLLFFAPFGLADFVKRFSTVRLLLLHFAVASHVFSFSGISSLFGTFNMRFFSSIGYVLLAVLALLGIKAFATLIVPRVRKAVMSMTVGLLLFFVVGNGLFFRLQLNDKNLLLSPTSYLQRGVLEAFAFLDSTGDSGVVLTPPQQFLGLVVPIYVDKTVFMARPVMTVDYEQKSRDSNMFYLGVMKESVARDFVKDNTIRYVLSTSQANGQQNSVETYPFMREIYRNDHAVIYMTQHDASK